MAKPRGRKSNPAGTTGSRWLPACIRSGGLHSHPAPAQGELLAPAPRSSQANAPDCTHPETKESSKSFPVHSTTYYNEQFQITRPSTASQPLAWGVLSYSACQALALQAQAALLSSSQADSFLTRVFKTQHATDTPAVQPVGFAPRKPGLRAAQTNLRRKPQVRAGNSDSYLNVGCIQFLLHNLFQDDKGRFDCFFQRH